MVTIIFESHATTLDNERKIASGHYDVPLSPRGEQQARELGERRAQEHFDAVFCSDLQRAYRTAQLAFGNKFPVTKDARLRECDYGVYEHTPSDFIDAQRVERVHVPFPDGESLQQTATRVKAFLQDILHKYDGKKVLIIGHRATWIGLETWAKHRALPDIVSASWHYQPGWVYELSDLS